VEGVPGFGEFMRYTPGQNDLSQVRVAALYEVVIDQMRDADEVAHLLAELRTGYLHRGFFRWRGMAPIERQYDVYGILADAISTLKTENPEIGPSPRTRRWASSARS